jgi:hypothetical protein
MRGRSGGRQLGLMPDGSDLGLRFTASLRGCQGGVAANLLDGEFGVVPDLLRPAGLVAGLPITAARR